MHECGTGKTRILRLYSFFACYKSQIKETTADLHTWAGLHCKPKAVCTCAKIHASAQ